LIVESHRLIAQAIELALQDEDMEVAEVASNATEALAAVRHERPEVILIDLALPDADASEVSRRLMESCPGTKVIALADWDDPALHDAGRLGFHGYVSKAAPRTEFVRCVTSVLHGLRVAPVRSGNKVPAAASPDDLDAARRAEQLTAREREVLALLVEGCGSDDMAHRLSLSHNTVRTHLGNILMKLGVHSRVEAAAFSIRNGIVGVPRGGKGGSNTRGGGSST
jgi:two-component system, NarL family, nitrate/nitrite response regulator NarL